MAYILTVMIVHIHTSKILKFLVVWKHKMHRNYYFQKTVAL